MNPEFKTRAELAKELRISYSTLKRKLKQAGISLPNGLLSPETQASVKEAIGAKSTIPDR